MQFADFLQTLPYPLHAEFIRKVSRELVLTLH